MALPHRVTYSQVLGIATWVFLRWREGVVPSTTGSAETASGENEVRLLLRGDEVSRVRQAGQRRAQKLC